MDLKTGIVCSLPFVLLICTVCSDAFALRKPDGQIPYKRNEGTSMKRFPIDGPVPYKRFYDGDVPYKRDDDHLTYKRGWWLSKPTPNQDNHDDLDEDRPYKRQYGSPDDIDLPYKKSVASPRAKDGHPTFKRGWWSSKANPHPKYIADRDFHDLDEDRPMKRQHGYPDDDFVPYKKSAASGREPRNESLERVLRYLLDMEERLQERSVADKRDHDDQ